MRAVDRAAAAGYRDDWRGVVAYVFSPECWRPGPYVAFLTLVVAFLALTQDLTGRLPVLRFAIKAAGGYWFVVRPVLGVIGRRRQIRFATSH